MVIKNVGGEQTLNYKLLWSILIMHIVFIIAGFFVLQYSVFLILSQSLSIHIIGYLFLLFFFGLCVSIHYLVVDMYDVKTSTKRKWFLSVGGMCFSTLVSFFFLAFLF